MSTPKQKILIFVDKMRMDLYTPALTDVVRFNYPPNVLRDLDIKDIDEFYNQIKTLIETYKIPLSQVIIMLSPNVIFEKIFPDGIEEQHQTEVDAFIENVPFQNVAYRTYKEKKGFKIVAINVDLCNAIETAFVNHGFIVEGLVPSFAYDKDEVMAGGINVTLGKSILGKADGMKSFDLLKTQEEATEDTDRAEEREADVKKQKMRMISLIAVFGILVVILLILVVTQLLPQQKKPATSTILPPLPTPTVFAVAPSAALISPTLSPTSSASAALNVDSIKVNILNGSGISGQADSLKKKLTVSGFKDIATGNASSTGNNKTLIIFATTVDNAVREKVISDVKKLFSDVSAQSTTGSKYDVIITTGKPL